MFITTFNVWGIDCPHILFAVTVMFPVVVPAVAAIESVDELPVHPPGKVHV
jgi:hypothetical protein